MSVELIKYAFIAGELSRSLFGRTDLTKYDLGVALAKNWFVDYRGGLSTRSGTEFLDYIKHDTMETKFFEFNFSPDLANTYVLLFGHNYVRFIQDGAYVLEEGKTARPASGNIISAPNHGYVDGDWVKLRETGNQTLNGRSFIVTDAQQNTFKIIDPRTNLPLAFAATTVAGQSARIYEVATPYTSEILADLSAFQIRDLVRLTHPLFRIRNLIRHDHTNWELALETTTVVVPRPVGLNATATEPTVDSKSRASVVYAVAAIMEDGTEGPISVPYLVDDIVNFTIEAGSVELTWNPVPGAVRYYVYRSHVAVRISTDTFTNNITSGVQLGFLGSVAGTAFIDSNIVPDFTRSPSEAYNPFSAGQVERIEVTNGGSGYGFAHSVTLTGGANFLGYTVTDGNGAITDVVIQRRGSSYTDSSVVSVAGGGTGATFVVHTIQEILGRDPSISALFQQRQMYAASLDEPLTLWGSQVKRYNNFSDVGTDSSGYEFELDSAEVAPIRHMLSMRGGLLLMSQTGIWLLTGSPQGGPVTPTNALADPQDYTGVSRVPPLKIGTDLLYIEGRGTSVRLLSYNDFSKVYSGEDQSILSAHLFSPIRQIKEWAFADNPHKMVHAVRSDGAILFFTIVKEQEVFAWTWGTTKGYFDNIISVSEEGFDRVYTTVRRPIGGVWRKYLERFAPRSFTHIEDAWAVDSGLKLEPPTIAAQLFFGEEFVEDETPYITLTSDQPVFLNTLGHFIRGQGGIYIVSEVIDEFTVKAFVREPATARIPEDPENRTPVAENGTWSMSPGYTSIGGLHHLEGELVSILGDGNVFGKEVVVDGEVILPNKVSKAVIGLGFTAVAQTLPPVVTDLPVEAKRKRVVGTAVRLDESRGLLAGRTLDELYAFKNRTNEPYGAPTRVINGFKHILLSTDWDEDGQTYFVQEDPLPASVLGLVPDLDFGDDND